MSSNKQTQKMIESSDEKWKNSVKKTTEPLDLLEEMFNFRSDFGFGDPYYRDLETVLLQQVEKILKEHGRKTKT